MDVGAIQLFLPPPLPSVPITSPPRHQMEDPFIFWVIAQNLPSPHLAHKSSIKDIHRVQKLVWAVARNHPSTLAACSISPLSKRSTRPR